MIITITRYSSCTKENSVVELHLHQSLNSTIPISYFEVCSPNIHLRRISCHGRNHSQASCEYSLTMFLCCQHHSEYSLLGSKFSTNLLFAASKCHVTLQQRGSSSVQNGRTGWDCCSGETLLAPCTRKKRLQRKITKHYHWIGVQENIGMFSKS